MEQFKSRMLFLVSVVILVLLYLMASTNLIIHEKKTEIYPISVIVEDSSDEDYEKLRKGMDRAAEEFHVDLNFITLYEPNDQEQQISLITREISDGAEAVILSPAMPVQAARSLDDMMLNSPVVVLGGLFPNEQVTAGISIDYMEAGKLLGTAVREDGAVGPVYLISEGLDYGYARELSSGIQQVLEAAGYETILSTLYMEEDCRKLIEGLAASKEQRAVLVALDENSLEAAARIMDSSREYGQQIKGLYGIGGTNRILNYLDKGIIRGLVVHNWFDEGYLSVEKAVEAIQGGGGIKEQIIMDAYYITKEDMRDPAYEKLLYPID
ncbi:MAG: substrate-binding domain-containing protein [Lachnospiraceae bacterium]|nr:substrate-binding domain-containing protein [Lachnospiraceae bacterium]